MLDDCKPQSGAAGALGAGFVHPVEALTQARQMLPRNADARVTDSQYSVPGCLADGDVDAPARLIVVDRVGKQIVDQLIYFLGIGGYLAVARDARRQIQRLHAGIQLRQ